MSAAPQIADWLTAMQPSWPAAQTVELPGWSCRLALGAGSRVNSATALRADADPALVERFYASHGVAPCFQVLPEQSALDATLAARGHVKFDPTLCMVADAAALATGGKAGFVIGARLELAAVTRFWQGGGIGRPRLDVMKRVSTPKLWLYARDDIQLTGAAFVAMGGTVAGAAVAFVHAVHVAPQSRRLGHGSALIRAAARFALTEGATKLALFVTEANRPAYALYDRLGFVTMGQYHYRGVHG